MRRKAGEWRLDERGITGVIFAITTAILIGAVAIATEGGLWYLGRQQAYSVADAAAIAGVLAYANGDSASGAARALAGQNGFGTLQEGQNGSIAGASGSTVNVNNPPSSGTHITPSATEVVIDVTFPTYLASLFHAADIRVASRAVAMLKQTGQACALSLTGDLTISMGVDGNAFGGVCYLASNATDSGAITLTGDYSNGVQISAFGISTRGGCSPHCPSVDPLWGLVNSADDNDPTWMNRPVATYQPSTNDPFANLSASLGVLADVSTLQCPTKTTVTGLTYPDYPGSTPPLDANNCPLSPVRVTITGAVPPTKAPVEGGTTACGAATLTCAFFNMYVTFDASVTIQPGAYLFLNASLSVAANATVACADPANIYQCGSPDFGTNSGITGVNFIFAGITSAAQSPQMGQINIDPTATVSLYAASPSPYPPMSGILFFRDAGSLPQDSAGDPSVVIADDGGRPGTPSILEGIMYFPGANAWFAANVFPSGWTPAIQFDCAVVIAGTLNIGYRGANQSSNIAHFGNLCSSYGFVDSNTLPAVQAAALVE